MDRINVIDIIKRLLGVEEVLERLERVEARVEELESKVGSLTKIKVVDIRTKILDALDKPKSTSELASMLKKSRTYVSMIINELEAEGVVKEVGRRGRAILYGRVE